MRSKRQAHYFFGLTREAFVGCAWAAGGVVGATGVFWLMRGYLDTGQASLLYLPVVIACAVRFGFGPAVLGAVSSFFCWNFFFLPPLYTLAIQNPRDWLSLFVFLLAALTTAHLAARARGQAQEAEARERETMTLYQASEAISSEVEADRLLPTLAARIVHVCGCTRCVVLRRVAGTQALSVAAIASEDALTPHAEQIIHKLAETACEHNQVIGFGTTRGLWARAAGTLSSSAPVEAGFDPGIYVPLRVQEKIVGALHVGPRRDETPFSAIHQRLILTLSNYAGVVIARETLAEEAAQAVALREADTLKDTLLSMVSHELRTPLAAIKATASGLRQQAAVWNEDARDEAIRAIDVEADRLAALVGNLLDLSRLEAGAWRPSKDWCDLSEIISTALDRLPDEQAARVDVSLPDDLPLLRADYTQIALVLTNLLENAVKYTPPGSPIQLVAAALPGSPGEAADSVRLAVRDRGPGIAPDEAVRLFERFYRGRAHQGSAVHGTGLGLALCRAVVQAHGGRIWAGNAPPGEPHGAVFSLTLPVSEVDEDRTRRW